MALFYDNDGALDAAARSRAAQAAREERKNRKKAKARQSRPIPVREYPKPENKPEPAVQRKRTEKWLKYKRGMGLEFYDSDKWREVRAVVLKAGNGVCCKCGGTKASTGLPMQVDHAYPRYSYPSLELDLRNLQVMCEPCNMQKKSRIWVSPWLEERRKQLQNGKSDSDRCQNPPP